MRDPLPAWRGEEFWPRSPHIPGTGTQPDRAPLHAAKQLVRRPVRAEGWREDRAYRYGAALCAQEFFWEAHEVWEAVWLACPPNGAERRFLRALIQLANAGLKVKMGRSRAALRLLYEAQGLLAEVPASEGEGFMGIPLPALRSAIQACTSTLGQADAAQPVSLEAVLAPFRQLAL